MERQFKVAFIDMEHENMEIGHTQTSSGRQNSDATNLTRHFKVGSPSLEGGMTPLNNFLG